MELESQRISYDTLVCIGEEFDQTEADNLCKTMQDYTLRSCRTKEEKEQIKVLSLEKLEDFGLLVRRERKLCPTNGY